MLDKELTRLAVEKIGSADILINIISKRIKQLTAGGGPLGRPLIENADGMSSEEIALREVIGDRITWEPRPEDE